MRRFFDYEEGEYLVVVNGEGHYSVWRPFKAAPTGWRVVGPRGSRQDCLRYIDECWTGMRREPSDDAPSA